MNTIDLALDSVIQTSDATARTWADRYARYLAAQLDEEFGGEHRVRYGQGAPPAEYRDAINAAYDRWCGLSDEAQAQYA